MFLFIAPLGNINIFMITPIDTTISQDTFQKLKANSLQDFRSTCDLNKSKTTLNKPTGNFFYDPWEIKKEFKNTIYEEVLQSLNISVGEARIITLKPGTCYHSHSDIDDRFHLSIQGQYSYLINLDNQQMYSTQPDAVWYSMDAGFRHVATNFGSIDRIQMVVRMLLDRNNLSDPIRINLFAENSLEKPRFVFDDTISPWLNRASKKGIIANFQTDLQQVWFDIESDKMDDLLAVLPEGINFNTNRCYSAK